jgi:heme-degrading monooxygenase HmoA
MIARIWHGTTREADGERYLAYLRRTGEKDCRETPGNRGVLILREIRDGTADFLFISLWDSMESIHAFAGDDVERARYYPEDREMLLELEPNVRHCEVFGDTAAEILARAAAVER